jgi:hypothetical protein
MEPMRKGEGDPSEQSEQGNGTPLRSFGLSLLAFLDDAPISMSCL